MKKYKSQQSRLICLGDFEETHQNEFNRVFPYANDYSLTKILKDSNRQKITVK